MGIHDLRFTFDDSVHVVRERLDAIGWPHPPLSLEEDPDGLIHLDLLIEAPTLLEALEWTQRRISDAQLKAVSATVHDDRLQPGEMLVFRPHREVISVDSGESPRA